MKRYSLLSGLWRAPLFLKSFYVDVATNWRGIGVTYLLMLELLTSLVVMISMSAAFNRFVSTELTPELTGFPPITITAGVASSPVTQPFIMKSTSGASIFALDTTGMWLNPADAGPGILFLVTKTDMIQDDGHGSIRKNSLRGLPDGTYDGPWILNWAHWLGRWMLPLGVPLTTLCAGVFRMIGALLLALIGLGLNAAFKGNLSFAALLRLAITSMTGSMLINTALSFTHFNFGCFLWVLLPGLTLGYLIYAVKVSTDAIRPLEAFPVEFPNPSVLPPPPVDPTEQDMFP